MHLVIHNSAIKYTTKVPLSQVITRIASTSTISSSHHLVSSMKTYPAIVLALASMAGTYNHALATSLRGKPSDDGASTHTHVKKKDKKKKSKQMKMENSVDLVPSSQLRTSIQSTFPPASPPRPQTIEPSASPSWQNSSSPPLSLDTTANHTTSEASHGNSTSPSENDATYQPTVNPTRMKSKTLLLDPSSIPTCDAPKSTWQSSLVYCEDGRLRYKMEKNGHKIPDFGHVGYRNGESLPDVPVRVTIGPIEGDNTKHIQDAIDLVSLNYQPDENGIRGAVLLRAGIYSTDNIIYLNHDGVILRGTGSGEDPASNTIIRSTRTGADDTVFHMGVRESSSENWDGAEHGKNVSITPRQIPIGERTIPVSDASPFKAGDLVVVRQKKSDRWYDAVDNGGTVNDPGWKERDFNWMDISYTRFVSAVGSNDVTIDAPLFHELNADHGNLTMYKYNST